MDYERKLIIIKAIKQRLEILKTKVEQQRIKDGNCPHKNLLDATTFPDRQAGFYVYICKDCGKRMRQPVISKGEPEIFDEDS